MFDLLGCGAVRANAERLSLLRERSRHGLLVSVAG
jgi:hypothetical protein